MSRAMARPRPTPFSFWLRDSSRRLNGRKASSCRSSGIPGPSSSTKTHTPPLGRAVDDTRTVSPWAAALSIRLARARLKALGRRMADRSSPIWVSIRVPARAAPSQTPSISGLSSTSRVASPPSPRANDRYSSIMCSISDRSPCMAWIWPLGSAKASSSFSRVRGVRRSWLTEASRAVRCSIWRWMRAFMARKAWAAILTSRAPCGLKASWSMPRPKASAAWARRSMARTWLRMNRIATAVSNRVATTIHRMKIWPWVAKARSRGAMIRSTPSCTCTRMSTWPG